MCCARSELPGQLQGHSTHRAGDEDREGCLETHSATEANLSSFFGMGKGQKESISGKSGL